MVTANRGHVPAVGCYEDLAIMVGDVAVHTPIFAVVDAEQGLILGQPFTHEGKLQTEEQGDGTTVCVVHSSDCSRKVV